MRRFSPGGSSPRMRGTHAPQLLDHRLDRFIPAYAGNTCNLISGIATCTVHPRVCGEHEHHLGFEHPQSGSSPRMRGTRLPLVALHAQLRFIPAYAGNTSSSKMPSANTAVHPRVCGEHGPNASINAASNGSSPRMRGTLERPLPQRGYLRFIPAYAGNTPLGSRTSIAPAVHPRVCGEHMLPSRYAHGCGGSSPRMRGTLC